MQFENLKNTFFNQKIQQIVFDKNGTILESDQTLFSVKKGSVLYNFHLFFETLPPLLENLTEPLSFPCISLDINNIQKIVDIELIPKDDVFYILLIDLTEHYQYSHPVVQEKNEVTIAKYKLDFEHQLLTAKEAFKNKFLAHLNHEIRTPLTSLLGFTEILTETSLDYDQTEMVKTIYKTGTQIQLMMNDLLDISKIEQGALELKEVNFDIAKLMASIERFYHLKFKNSALNLEVNLQEHIHRYYVGDPLKLNQILHNIILALTQQNNKGVISININQEEAKEDKPKLQFTITGAAGTIATNTLKNSFNSYHQLQMDAAQPLGEGLGLKIVQELVSLMQGTVSAKINSKNQLAFSLQIPFKKRTPSRKKRSVPKGSGVYLGKNILLVEDNLETQMLFMKQFLNNDNGYVLELANTIDGALKIINKKAIKLILTAPSINRIDTSQIIKKYKENNPDIPILVSTTKNTVQEEASYLKAGATQVISLPISKKELFKTLKKYL